MSEFLSYLTVIAAESIAAHGSLGQGAHFAAVVSLSGTLLQKKDGKRLLIDFFICQTDCLLTDLKDGITIFQVKTTVKCPNEHMFLL